MREGRWPISADIYPCFDSEFRETLWSGSESRESRKESMLPDFSSNLRYVQEIKYFSRPEPSIR